MKFLLVIVVFFLASLVGFIFLSRSLNNDITTRENNLICLGNLRTYLYSLKESFFVSLSTNAVKITNFDNLQDIDSKISCIQNSQNFEEDIRNIKEFIKKVQSAENITNKEVELFNKSLQILNTKLN